MDQSYPVWPGWKTLRKLGEGSYGSVWEIQRDLRGRDERAALKYIRIPQKDSDIAELQSLGYDEESIRRTFSTNTP